MDPSYMDTMFGPINDMFQNFIIRPPRSSYPKDKLGTEEVKDAGLTYKITHSELKNPKGETLQCSFVEPADSARPSAQMPCVVYMHGNGGNKLEGLMSYTELLIPAGFTLFCFDFSGCGQSEGQWVTLGWKEVEDLRAVTAYLKGLGTVSKIAFWGRSMGAATALMYQASHPDASAIIADSSYAALLDLVMRMGTKMGVPPEMVQFLLLQVKLNVEKQTGGMKLDDLNPAETAAKVTVPALLIHADDDELIPFDHLQKICDKYGGPKKQVVTKGGHNGMRSEEVRKEALEFLKQHLA